MADAVFLSSLERDTGVRWRRLHGAPGEIEVLVSDGNLTTEEMAARLRKRSDILYATADRRKTHHAVPNDSLFGDQWYLQNTQPAALGATLAWDTTTGSAGTIVAVLDSGIRFDHPDLARATQAGKLLPGYDFISADAGSGGTRFLTANDGDGRDADPTDPGDWIDSTDRRQSIFADCAIENSSWHGTRVAGLISAASNNGIGVAGVSWQTWILPVRVLGKCGGYDADILTAMRWAAGLSVSGVANNPYPANIINLSLGASHICTAPYQQVIQELNQHGVVVIASAGNEGGQVSEPANCPGVIAVGGLRHAGTKVGYSSLGPEVTLSAPAGNCVNLTGECLFSLGTTYDLGRLTPSGPGYTDHFNTNLGTSFSAPLASGVGALMHAVNAKLTPIHIQTRLKESARPFPDGGATPPPTCHVPTGPSDLQQSECVCTTSTCGAGMLYAPAAIVAAQRPIASVVAPNSITPGTTLDIDGSESSAACNRALAAYSWTVVSNQGTSTPVLVNADRATVQVVAPTAGTYTLRLTVTDDRGSTDSGEIVVTNQSAVSTTTAPLAVPACPVNVSVAQDTQPPPSPQNSPSASQPAEDSGGGAFGFPWLLLLLLLAIYFKPNSSCRNS